MLSALTNQTGAHWQGTTTLCKALAALQRLRPSAYGLTLMLSSVLSSDAACEKRCPLG